MDWFSIKNKSSSMTEALALYKEARAPRDYKREYAQYHSKPSRVAERSQRNKARRKLGLEKGDPREVDHKNPISNGGSNARSNLRAVSLQANRKKFTKTANDHHHLVTGHSGSGKSTLANKLSKELGLPVHALDWDPEVEKLWAYQKEYAKKNEGKLDMSDERKDYEKRVKLDAIHRALKMKDPRVIEGSYLMYEDPASFGNHKRYLVNPSKETVLEQRLNRKKQKDIKRGRGWTPEAERQARHRGIEVYNLYEPYAKKWRDSSLVEKRASTKHHLITGVPGAGKSTVAKRIAKEKGLPLFEIDSDPRFKKALQLVDEGKIDESNALQRQMFRDAVTRKDPHVIEGAQIMLDPALARQHELQILDDSADVLAPRWSKREAGKHRDRALKSGREPYKDEAYYDKLYRDTVYPRYQKQLEGLRKTADDRERTYGDYVHTKEAKKLTTRARNRISEGNFAPPLPYP